MIEKINFFFKERLPPILTVLGWWGGLLLNSPPMVNLLYNFNTGGLQGLSVFMFTKKFQFFFQNLVFHFI